MLLAVYGTLKKQQHNHQKYLKEARFVKYGNIKGILLYFDGFPGLVLFDDIPESLEPLKKFANTYTCGVEVYDIADSSVGKIDIMEQHPYFFKRVPIKLENTGEVHVYTLPWYKYLKGHQRMTPGGYWYGTSTGYMNIDFYEGDKKPKIMGWGNPRQQPIIVPAQTNIHHNHHWYGEEFEDDDKIPEETIIDLDILDQAKEA